MSVTALEAMRKTALTAAAMGLWSVVNVSAMCLILGNDARWMVTPSHHNMKICAARAQTPQSAAAGAPVWQVSVSATGWKIQKSTVDDTVSAATLTVHTITTGTVPQEKKKIKRSPFHQYQTQHFQCIPDKDVQKGKKTWWYFTTVS